MQQLRAIDIAYSGNDLLIDEQGSDRALRGLDSSPREIGLGVVAQRVRTQSRPQREDSVFVEQLADGRVSELAVVRRREQAPGNVAVHGRLAAREVTVESARVTADRDRAVHGQVEVRGELETHCRDEQMLADGLSVGDDPTIEDLRLKRAVGRAGAHRLSDELSQPPGDPVDRMTLGHDSALVRPLDLARELEDDRPVLLRDDVCRVAGAAVPRHLLSLGRA